MTIGPATIMAIIAAALATLLWWIAAKAALPAWVAMFLFGVALALVILAGPLKQLWCGDRCTGLKNEEMVAW